MTTNRRLACPKCDCPVPMHFVFPTSQADYDVEAVIWRFQRCTFCGWMGDCQTGKEFTIGRDVWSGWRINERHYENLRQWLKEIKLI